MMPKKMKKWKATLDWGYIIEAETEEEAYDKADELFLEDTQSGDIQVLVEEKKKLKKVL